MSPELVLGLDDLPTESIILTKDEVELLWEFLSHQYIPYDNIELRLLVRKLGHIVDELAEYPNRAT